MSVLSRWFNVSVVAGAMIAGTGDAQGTSPEVVATEYDNVSPGKLISVFRKAYAAAGFKLAEEKTRVMYGGGEKLTRLVFEMSNPEQPRNKKGRVSFNIVSQSGPAGALAGRTPDPG